MDRTFVVCETSTGQYVKGRRVSDRGMTESMLFLVKSPLHAARMTRDEALGVASALPCLGLRGTFAVEEVER